jgi:hypothetical protein
MNKILFGIIPRKGRGEKEKIRSRRQNERS